MKALIVDDEPLARSRLTRLLSEHSGITLVGEACNTDEALALIHEHQPELLFLDIQMPGMDGLTFAKTLNNVHPKPGIILVTAHPEHALDAFDIGPIDYILKPVDPARLKKSIKRAFEAVSSTINNSESQWISFKKGDTYQRISFTQVLYFLAEENLTRMFYDSGEAILEESLKGLESRYQDRLLRINRHLLVNRERVIQLKQNQAEHSLLLAGSDTPLPVSRRRVSDVKAALKPHD